MKSHLEKRQEKTQKPFRFLGFLPRYLNRCYFLVAGVGPLPHDRPAHKARGVCESKNICFAKWSSGFAAVKHWLRQYDALAFARVKRSARGLLNVPQARFIARRATSCFMHRKVRFIPKKYPKSFDLGIFLASCTDLDIIYFYYKSVIYGKLGLRFFGVFLYCDRGQSRESPIRCRLPPKRKPIRDRHRPF